MKLAFSLFFKQFRRELLIQGRQIRWLIHFCLFFFIILLIFPLTLKPEVLLLRTIAPGLIWMGLLLAMLLSSEGLFQQEQEQGILEQWLVFGHSFTGIVLAKVLAHWVLILLPMMLLTPMIALLFSFSPWEAVVLFLSFLCGTPALIFLCALAASFGLGVNQKGALMALIVLPLTLPLLIFGSGTLSIAMQGFPIRGFLALLLAMSVLTVAFLPYAIAAILRIGYAD